MKVQFHMQCPDCEGISVFERDMKYQGSDAPQIHIPFSVDENEFKCKGCGIVWGVDVEFTNLTKEFGAEDGDMPVVEGASALGRVRAGHGGGLTIEVETEDTDL